MTRETDLAWAAGLFDGEGCVTTLWPGRFQVRLEIQMVHKPTLQKLSSILGGSIHKSYEKRPNHRAQWRWRVCDRKAVEIAGLLHHYSSEKKLQLKNLIEFKNSTLKEDRDRHAKLIKDDKSLSFD